MAPSRTIGIIAGSGVYPETFIAAARRHCPGVKLVVAALHGETKPELGGQADAIEWIRVAQLGKLIRFFRGEGVTEAVMLGRISPGKLFDMRPDLRVLMILCLLYTSDAADE